MCDRCDDFGECDAWCELAEDDRLGYNDYNEGYNWCETHGRWYEDECSECVAVTEQKKQAELDHYSQL